MGVVYCAQNKIDQKIYIGKTIRTLTQRKLNHKGKAQKGLDNYFQRAIRKHGFNNFLWCILSNEDDENKLNELEKYWIKELETTNIEYGYNIREGGKSNKVLSVGYIRKISELNKGINNPQYGKTHTKDTKELISIAAKERWNNPIFRKKMYIALSGRIVSEETKRKISQTRINRNVINGMLGKYHTKKAKLKMSEAHTGMKHTKETIENMCKAQSGENNPMYGRKHTKESKKKMSEAQKIRKRISKECD